MSRLPDFLIWRENKQSSGGPPVWKDVEPQELESQSEPSLDANELTIVDWMKVRGIGKTLATRLVENGPYESLDDVIKVKGVSKGTFERINETLGSKFISSSSASSSTNS